MERSRYAQFMLNWRKSLENGHQEISRNKPQSYWRSWQDLKKSPKVLQQMAFASWKVLATGEHDMRKECPESDKNEDRRWESIYSCTSGEISETGKSGVERSEAEM